MRQKLPQVGQENAYRPLPPPPTATHPLSGHLPRGGGNQRRRDGAPEAPLQPDRAGSPRKAAAAVSPHGFVVVTAQAAGADTHTHGRKEKQSRRGNRAALWPQTRCCASTQPGPPPSRRRAGKGGACGGREGGAAGTSPAAFPPLLAPQERGRELQLSMGRWLPKLR